jgi:hypothetical protein
MEPSEVIVLINLNIHANAPQQALARSIFGSGQSLDAATLVVSTIVTEVKQSEHKV